jgi:endo-1,4-beta-xylanase
MPFSNLFLLTIIYFSLYPKTIMNLSNLKFQKLAIALMATFLTISCQNAELAPSPEVELNSPSSEKVAATTTDLKLRDLTNYKIGIESILEVLQNTNTTLQGLFKSQYNSIDARFYGGEIYTNGSSSSTNWGTMNYSRMDAYYNYATSNTNFQRVHGHCLLYHVGLNGAINDNGGSDGNDQGGTTRISGGQADWIWNHTTAEFETVVRQQIENIMARNKTKIAARSYDVMNEVVSDFSGYRKSIFRYKYLTDADFEGFIIRCYTWARQNDPDALLFYNDYNWENQDGLKRGRIVALINKLKQQTVVINGVTRTIIDGVGVQTHLTTSQNMTYYDEALKAAAGTGLLVHVSELDVTTSGNTEAEIQKQTDIYRRVPQAYYTHVPAAQRFGITMWDLGDNNSWLGANNYATPYDGSGNYNKKPAYWGLATGIAGSTRLPTDKFFSITPSSGTVVLYAPGANQTIKTNAYTGAANQKWQLDHIGNGVYRVKNSSTNGYISGNGGATGNATALISNTATNNSQKFKITPLGNGTFSMIADGTNQGMDRISTNGNMQFYNYGGGANQKMILQVR